MVQEVTGLHLGISNTFTFAQAVGKGGWGAITLSPYRMPYLTCLKRVGKFISVSKNKIPVAAEEMRLESLMNSLPGHKVGPK